MSAVAASSPAAKAGVRGGDIVVGVGTLSVAGMSRGNIQRLLAGEEGSPMVLGFERPRKPCGTVRTLCRIFAQGHASTRCLGLNASTNSEDYAPNKINNQTEVGSLDKRFYNTAH